METLERKAEGNVGNLETLELSLGEVIGAHPLADHAWGRTPPFPFPTTVCHAGGGGGGEHIIYIYIYIYILYYIYIYIYIERKRERERERERYERWSKLLIHGQTMDDLGGSYRFTRISSHVSVRYRFALVKVRRPSDSLILLVACPALCCPLPAPLLPCAALFLPFPALYLPYTTL